MCKIQVLVSKYSERFTVQINPNYDVLYYRCLKKQKKLNRYVHVFP